MVGRRQQLRDSDAAFGAIAGPVSFTVTLEGEIDDTDITSSGFDSELRVTSWRPDIEPGTFTDTRIQSDDQHWIPTTRHFRVRRAAAAVRQSCRHSTPKRIYNLTSRTVNAGTAPGPVSDAPSLPEIERLPSIRVIAETPVEPQPSYKRTYPNFSMRKDSGTHQVNDNEIT